MDTASPPVSPRVVARIFVIQKIKVTSGTLLRMSCFSTPIVPRFDKWTTDPAVANDFGAQPRAARDFTCGSATNDARRLSVCSALLAGVITKPTLTVRKSDYQKCQTEPQLVHFASVAASLRDNPVANNERPPVRIAPVTLPPLTPFFKVTLNVVTCPL